MPKNIDPTDNNLDLEPYQVILKPIVTEKGVYASEHYNSYAFEVHKLASKELIKYSIEQLFNVKVLEVKTQNRKGKLRRTKNGYRNLRSWKKAYVKLHPESRIDYF